MKKWLVRTSGILSLLLCIFLFAGFTENQKVYDQADLLTAEESEALQQRCLEIARSKEVDIVIVTTDDAQGKTARDYADDFFDYHDFGYDKPRGTGILYLIDMDNRMGWVSTSGGAITYFTDQRISQITKAIKPYLKDADYYESGTVFLDYVERFMGDLPQENDLYDYEGNTKGFHISLSMALLCLLFAAVIGGIAVFVMVHNAGGKVTVNSLTYLNTKGVHINQRYDTFTHNTTTTRTISNSTGSGGGASSTHSGSSGSSHGGGGCSF